MRKQTTTSYTLHQLLVCSLIICECIDAVSLGSICFCNSWSHLIESWFFRRLLYTEKNWWFNFEGPVSAPKNNVMLPHTHLQKIPLESTQMDIGTAHYVRWSCCAFHGLVSVEAAHCDTLAWGTLSHVPQLLWWSYYRLPWSCGSPESHDQVATSQPLQGHLVWLYGHFLVTEIKVNRQDFFT